MNLEIIPGGAAETRLAGEVGLRQASLALSAIHWQKQPEADGRLGFSARLEDDGSLEVDSFSLEAGDLVATGEASFGGDWGIQSVRLERLAYGGKEGVDVAGSIRKEADGGDFVELSGKRFDLRPYLDEGDTEEDAQRAPLGIAARLGTLVVGDETTLEDVSATARHDGQRWRSMRLVGRLNGGAPVELKVTPASGRREVSVSLRRRRVAALGPRRVRERQGGQAGGQGAAAR